MSKEYLLDVALCNPVWFCMLSTRAGFVLSILFYGIYCVLFWSLYHLLIEIFLYLSFRIVLNRNQNIVSHFKVSLSYLYIACCQKSAFEILR